MFIFSAIAMMACAASLVGSTAMIGVPRSLLSRSADTSGT